MTLANQVVRWRSSQAEDTRRPTLEERRVLTLLSASKLGVIVTGRARDHLCEPVAHLPLEPVAATQAQALGQRHRPTATPRYNAPISQTMWRRCCSSAAIAAAGERCSTAFSAASPACSPRGARLHLDPWPRGEPPLLAAARAFATAPLDPRRRPGLGGWERVGPGGMIASERAVNRHRHLPLLLAPAAKRSFRADLDRYTDILGRLYGAIREVSGARLIVDSTIDPAYGFLLTHVEQLDLRLVHADQGQPAAAFSWTRHQRVRDRVGA